MSKPPRVPSWWRSWLDAVSEAFAGSREFQARLAASEARFLGAVESLPDGLMILDAQDRIVYFNSRHPEFLPPALREGLRTGIRFEDWIREGLARGPVYHPDMGADYAQRRLGSRSLQQNDREHKHADGRWVRVRESPLPDGGRLILTTDVTARREAEERSRASEARFLAAAEGIPDGLVIFDAEDRFAYHNSRYPGHLPANLRAVLRLGLRHEDWLRGALERGPTCHPEMGSDFLERRFAARRLDRAESELKLIDGRWMRLRESRMADGGRVVLTTDVTEQKRAEQALRESEARYRAVVEGQSEFILRLHPDGTLTFVNDAYCRYRGLTRGVLLRGFNDVYHYPPEQQAKIHAAWEGLKPGFPSVTYELVKPHEDGEERWEEWTDTAIFAPDGRVVEYQAVGRDITGRKRAEQALKESEARFRLIAEGVPLPIAITAVNEHRVLFVNSKAREVFGIGAGAEGREAVERFWADPEQGGGLAARIAHEGAVAQAEVRLRRGDGVPFDALLSARPIRYDGSSALLGVVTDITERRRMEEALKASEQRFRCIAEAHPMPLLIVRLADSHIRFANAPFLRLYRIGERWEEGLTPEALYADPAGRRRFLEAMRREGAVDGLELELRRLDGSTFPGALTSRLVEYEGEPALFTSVVDLTPLKAAEAEIRHQREILYQSEKLTALGSLLAGVAHELNNPLSVVVGYAGMLEELAQDDGTRQRAERIRVAAERCAKIVRTFLAMARSRPPQRAPVAINEMLAAALEIAAYGLRTSDVAVVRDLDPDPPFVWGDSDQLHQVFTNLIVNAQHALLDQAPPRRLVVRSQRRGGKVVVAVEDNGLGMPEEVRRRIFEPFFTTKPPGVGTGIGLSICHSLVAAHDGRITVESGAGQGTRFAIVLPLLAPDSMVPDTAVVEAPAAAGCPGKVLVVDDEQEIAELVTEHLRREGFAVEVASSGRAALARLKREAFDLIVTDLRMPDLDGATLIQALGQQYPELARRLLVITGDALGAELNEVVRAANLPVLEKPLDLASLGEQLRRMLSER